MSRSRNLIAIILIAISAVINERNELIYIHKRHDMLHKSYSELFYSEVCGDYRIRLVDFMREFYHEKIQKFSFFVHG